MDAAVGQHPRVARPSAVRGERLLRDEIVALERRQVLVHRAARHLEPLGELVGREAVLRLEQQGEQTPLAVAESIDRRSMHGRASCPAPRPKSTFYSFTLTKSEGAR